jgi:hypothetical protein
MKKHYVVPFNLKKKKTLKETSLTGNSLNLIFDEIHRNGTH